MTFYYIVFSTSYEPYILFTKFSFALLSTLISYDRTQAVNLSHYISVRCCMLGFSVVCHECGQILYEGRDMIPLYRLRIKTDGKCPSCGRRLGIRPLSIDFNSKEFTNLHFRKS